MISQQIPNNQTKPNTAPNNSKGRYYIFLVAYLVGLSAFGSFVNDMYLPSLPSMRTFFDCSVSTVQLGLTFGMIGLGVGQLILGPISDKYGRKSVLLITLVIFIVAAIVSVFSPTIHFFLVCRLFQGIGASGGYFLARTIPADIYSGRGLARIMALIGAINGFAPASAPVIGGLLTNSLGWKGVFAVLAAYAALLLVLSWGLKESLPVERRFTGSIASSFKEYKSLLKNRRFIIHVMLKGTSLGLLFAYVSASPFIFQTHYGWTAVEFGFIMGFNAIFIAIGSVIALRFKLLKNAAYVGGWVLIAATAVEIVMLLCVHNIWLFEIGLLPMIFAMGMIFTVANTLAMNEGRSNAGGASAVLGATGYAFGATVAPLVGMGNILISTSIVMGAMAVITLLFSLASARLTPDSNMLAS